MICGKDGFKASDFNELYLCQEDVPLYIDFVFTQLGSAQENLISKIETIAKDLGFHVKREFQVSDKKFRGRIDLVLIKPNGDKFAIEVENHFDIPEGKRTKRHLRMIRHNNRKIRILGGNGAVIFTTLFEKMNKENLEEIISKPGIRLYR